MVSTLLALVASASPQLLVHTEVPEGTSEWDLEIVSMTGGFRELGIKTGPDGDRATVCTDLRAEFPVGEVDGDCTSEISVNRPDRAEGSTKCAFGTMGYSIKRESRDAFTVTMSLEGDGVPKSTTTVRYRYRGPCEADETPPIRFSPPPECEALEAEVKRIAEKCSSLAGKELEACGSEASKAFTSFASKCR